MCCKPVSSVFLISLGWQRIAMDERRSEGAFNEINVGLFGTDTDGLAVSDDATPYIPRSRICLCYKTYLLSNRNPSRV